MPPPMSPPGIHEPAAVKVFGVIHLVFAGLGFLMGLWSLVSPWLGRMIMPADMPGMAEQMKFQDQLLWVTLMTGAFMLVLAVLLLVSGLKLVRSRPDGVKWSHRYAWTSIGTKLVSLVVTVAWVLPLTQRMMENTVVAGGGSADRGFLAAMKGAVAVSSTITPLLSCLYPALALYFLSRPAVKAWCAARSAGAP